MRGWRERWGSHKDQAIKALEKLAGPHVPASLKAIERAVRKADSDRDRAVATANRQAVDSTPGAGGESEIDVDPEAVQDDPVEPEA